MDYEILEVVEDMNPMKIALGMAIRLLETGDDNDMRVAIKNLKEIFDDMPEDIK